MWDACQELERKASRIEVFYTNMSACRQMLEDFTQIYKINGQYCNPIRLRYLKNRLLSLIEIEENAG